MDDIIKDFLIESNENLDRLDQELVKLEADPTSRELLDSIFRTIHTIKGSCGFLGFSRLEKVAHPGENLLSKLREGQLTLNSEITSGVLAMVDAVRRMLAEIQSTERDGDNDYPELLAQLKALQENNRQPEPPADNADQGASEVQAGIGIVEADAAPSAQDQPSQSPSSKDETTQPQASPAPEHLRPSASKIGGVLVDRGSIDPSDLAVALQEQERGDRRRIGEILAALGFCRLEDVNAAQQILESRVPQTGVETVRVGVDLLDMLMNLVGELVLARNQLLQASNSLQDAPLQSVSQRIRVKIEIQDDGGGLNVDRLLKKAIERGLVHEHQAKTMAERDIFNLIFLPGFSTESANLRHSRRNLSASQCRFAGLAAGQPQSAECFRRRGDDFYHPVDLVKHARGSNRRKPRCADGAGRRRHRW